MPSQRHGVAVVGCGSMGQAYIRAYDTYPDTELIALAAANGELVQVTEEYYLHVDTEQALRDQLATAMAGALKDAGALYPSAKKEPGKKLLPVVPAKGS